MHAMSFRERARNSGVARRVKLLPPPRARQIRVRRRFRDQNRFVPQARKIPRACVMARHSGYSTIRTFDLECASNCRCSAAESL